jgi:hypothetical protein
MLHSRSITLLDPSSWDDTNDSYFLLKYKEKKKFKSVLALCLTQTEETYHHWRVFAGHTAGACVIFDRPQLLSALSVVPGIRTGGVDYKRLRDARRSTVHLSVEELPFIKRFGFMPEAEFRLLYTSADEQLKFLDVPIPLDCIVEVRLSPWLNSRLRQCLKDTIHSIDGCDRLVIHRSTLIGNASWKKLGDRAT